MIPLPKIIDNTGAEIGRISPILASVNLNIIPLSSATLQLKPGDIIAPRALVEMFTINGSAGIFRARAPQYGYGDISTTVELEHSISMLGDYLIKGDIEQSMSASSAISQAFSYYLGGAWVLGTNEASETVVLTANYDTVLDTILSIMEQIPDYMLTFDQSSFPWVLNVVHRPVQVEAEGRLSRNISSVQITYDDSELCTRVWADNMYQEDTVGSMDADTINEYGIVERELSGYAGASSDVVQRAASLFLEKHKHPKMSVEISGIDLSDVTGEDIDNFSIGKLFRLAIPDENVTVTELITSMVFDDIYNAPHDIDITLAQEPDTVVNFIHEQALSGAGSGGGGGGGGGGLQKEQEKLFKRFETFYEQTDEKFSWLATDSEWDELAQEGRVTAYSELVRTSHFVEDTVAQELPFDDWKPKWLIQHPEDAQLTDEQLREKYRTWITTNPYAIYNTEYSDATRTERIISKTGINDLGESETLTSRVEQTAETLRSEIATSSSSLYSTFEQSLSGFRSEVGDTLNGYSATISQSANSIRAEVHNAISDIYARIIEWEGGGAIEVRNGNRTYKQWDDPTTTETEDLMAGDIWVKSNDTRTWAEMGVNDWNTSQLYEWADYRGDEVYVWKNGRWQLVVSSKDLVVQGSRLEVEQQEIWAVVDDDRNNLRAEISLTASQFYRTLTDTSDGLNSTITQTASQIRSEVTNSVSGLKSSITQTASQIRSEVSDTRNDLQSSITQTASQIRGEISDTRNNLQSSITQNANQISLKVSKGDIASTINQTAQSVLISASKINLQGYVTASELDAEKARFDNLTAGTTTATALKATLLQANSNFNLSGTNYAGRTLKIGSVVSATVLSSASAAVDFDHYHSITISESDGVITITTGKARASADTKNFNIADTAFYTNAMSAQWAAARGKVVMPSAGTETTFKVKVPSATEGEQEEKTFTIQKGATPTSSGYASVSLSGTVVGRIDIGDWYTAGKNAAHAEYTYHTGYLRGNSVSVTPIGSTYVNIKGYGLATLYKKNGDDYESVGNHYWYYRSDNGTKYYNQGTTQTYYTSGSYVAYYTRNISQ